MPVCASVCKEKRLSKMRARIAEAQARTAKSECASLCFGSLFRSCTVTVRQAHAAMPSSLRQLAEKQPC